MFSLTLFEMVSIQASYPLIIAPWFPGASLHFTEGRVAGGGGPGVATSPGSSVPPELLCPQLLPSLTYSKQRGVCRIPGAVTGPCLLYDPCCHSSVQ